MRIHAPLILALSLTLTLTLAVAAIGAPGEATPKPGPTPATAAARAAAELDRRAAEAIDLLFHYHDTPDPDAIEEAARDLLKSRQLRDWSNGGIVVGFLSQVFRANEARVEPWFDAWADFRTHDRFPVLLYALNMSAIDDRSEILRKVIDGASPKNASLIESYIENPAPDMLTFNLFEPIHLPILYGSYLAAGDTRYLDRILDVTLLERDDALPAMAALTLSFAVAEDKTARAWARAHIDTTESNPEDAHPGALELEYILEDAPEVHESPADFGLTSLGVPVKR